MTLEEWSEIATIGGALAGLVIGVVGFGLVFLQIRAANRISTSQVLLAADAVLATHADAAAKLRPGGEWADAAAETHPTTDELPLVEPYLGVFERIFVAYQAGQVDAETLDQLYGYRLANIWANKRLVDEKLQNDPLKNSWKRLIALTYVIEAHRKQRFRLHTDLYFPEELFDRRSARRICAAVLTPS